VFGYRNRFSVEESLVDVILSILAGFVAAAVAPTAHKLLRDGAGWAVAVIPAAIFVYFCTYLGGLPAGGYLTGIAWAPSFGLELTFRVDGLSLMFALLISGVGAIVMIYAGGYMHGDGRLGRLYALLLAFMASMLGLVLSDNIFAMFVFWELTSVTSYLLIGFDHHRPEARNAALQALLVTGGGGLALLAGLVLIGLAAQDLGVSGDDAFQISSLATADVRLQDHPLYLGTLVLVLAGAFTKSAQFPFHFWLPGAMEAPTPVSAYLHSATMVKAGVYLLARLSPLLGGTAAWQWSLTAFGSVTMLLGAMVAVKAVDLKQILAYSTISALGLLVMSIGQGGAEAAAATVGFILAHAIYKGALFLVAGAIDHGAGTRNVGLLSGLGRSMPITMAAAACAALSMAALPPFIGFIAKEQLYAATVDGPAPLLITGVTMVASALFIVIAAMVGLRPFLGQPSDAARHAHEGAFSIWLGPALLAASGLALGLSPALIDAPLLAPATRAMLNAATPERLKLALWHGVNLPLQLSLVTIVLGVALFFVRGRLAGILRRYDWGGMATLYDKSLRGMLWISERQTHYLQSGYLRYYLMTIFISLVIVVGYTVFVHERQRPSLPPLDISLYELAVCLLIPIACWATIRTTSRISAIVALGVVGYSMALLFVLYGAPDLAMTQFLVETLTVVLFVFAFYRLPREHLTSLGPARVRDGLIAVSVGGLMAGLVLLSTVGQPLREISNYYVEHAVPDAHGRNVVNVILVDFRALDTLGEITVLALAAAGVYSLIKLRPTETSG